MANTLFDLFLNYKYAKEIWDSFEKKYDVDDAGKKNMLSVSGLNSKWLIISQ